MLSSLRKACVDFLREEDGHAAIEYAVQLAVIAVVIANAVDALSSNANKSFNKASNAVNVGS
jgi:Flp pilus assembly pilin Flp